jgi:cytochrome bd ubiquinol oxidase subunit II
MLEDLVAGVVLISLITYALLGGADFGGGVWDLFAGGKRRERQRDLIADTIAPVWEANHVWLILVVVLLFTAFPAGFAAIMIALHVPMLFMLLGIVLRGSAFVFRKYDLASDRVQTAWSAVFGISSAFTPFVQGMIVGALASGRVRMADGAPVHGYFAGWIAPFPLACGLFSIGLFAYLAAVYLCVDASGSEELSDDFRKRALISGLALGPIAALVFVTSIDGAPVMFRQLTSWWAVLLVAWTSAFAVAALAGIWFRRYRLARVAAIGQVALILVGWGVSQYPYLIVPDVTVSETAAPAITLRLLLIALGLGALILLPSLYYLFHVFKTRGPGR